MIRHYVTILFPGVFFANTDIKVVSSRDPDTLEIPDGAEGFQFHDVEIAEHNGETLQGRAKNHSGWYYIGRKMSLDDVKREMPKSEILISNMECNKYSHVVKTARGSCYPLNENDKVITREGHLPPTDSTEGRV